MISPRTHPLGSQLGAFVRAILLTWASMLVLVVVLALTFTIPGGWLSILVVIGLGSGLVASREGLESGGRGESAGLPDYPVVRLDLPESSPLWDRELDGASTPSVVLRLDA